MRPWVEPTKDAKGSRRSEPAALMSCSLCYSHQHLIATVWGSVSQTQPSGSLTNSSQRRRDNKMGTAGFATNSRKHNIWCCGNHLKKKSSSYYHLWNNQPLPCPFNSEALLKKISVFWSLSRHSALSFHLVYLNTDVASYPYPLTASL